MKKSPVSDHDLALAASTFAALGSEQRLAVLRSLVRAGTDGLTIGELGHRTGVTGSTLTHHMKILAQAGLVTQEKQGRSIVCAAVACAVAAGAGANEPIAPNELGLTAIDCATQYCTSKDSLLLWLALENTCFSDKQPCAAASSNVPSSVAVSVTVVSTVVTAGTVAGGSAVAGGSVVAGGGAGDGDGGGASGAAAVTHFVPRGFAGTQVHPSAPPICRHSE